jgi:hypothetical protein
MERIADLLRHMGTCEKAEQEFTHTCLFRVRVSMSGITSFPAACRLVVTNRLLSRAGLPYNQDIIPGTQNERERDAAPVRRCLAAEASPADLSQG